MVAPTVVPKTYGGLHSPPHTDHNTASITTTNGSLVIIDVMTRYDIGATVRPTISGAAITAVTFVTEQIFAPDVGYRISRFKATGTGGTGVITIAHSDQWTCQWAVTEYTHASGQPVLLQTVFAKDETGSATSLTVNLSALRDADSRSHGTFLIIQTEVISPGSGFTQDGQDNTFDSIMREHGGTATAVNATVSAYAINMYGFADEIGAPTVAGGASVAAVARRRQENN